MPSNDSRSGRRPAKYGRRRAQHQPVDPIAMALPRSVGRPARPSNSRPGRTCRCRARRRRATASSAQSSSRNVRRDPQPTAVTAVVERHDAPAFGQRRVAGEEVEVGGRRPTVQEDQRRRTRRAGGVAHEQRPETRQLDARGPAAAQSRRGGARPASGPARRSVSAPSDRLDLEHGHLERPVRRLVA